MIRSHFGLDQNPFAPEHIALTSRQREVYDTLLVHAQQGGLCLLLGEPGTGKSTVKDVLLGYDRKRMITPVINRSLHTYPGILRILCEAFGIEGAGNAQTCEKRLILEAHKINRQGKMLVPIVDDAHLLDIDCLRRLRLMFEDFPKNHNLVLIAQPVLLPQLALGVNEDIKSRVTYSVMLRKLSPEDIEAFILDQLDRVGLAHNVFSEEALALVVRSADGVLRQARNLCCAALLETVRAGQRAVGLPEVNTVLTQPHWRHRDALVQRTNP